MRIFYFSAAGHCRELAMYFSSLLAAPAEEMGSAAAATDTAIVIFPVYCQTLPPPVRRWLPRLQAGNTVLIAAYGRMHPGSALYEASKLVQGRLIGAANVPTGHSYLGDSCPLDAAALGPLLERIAHPAPAAVPKKRRQIFAGLFPGLRSRLGVKMIRSDKCSSCGACQRFCPQKSMKKGRPGRDCLRCLRCVRECPKAALSFRLSPILKAYLAKAKYWEYDIYV